MALTTIVKVPVGVVEEVLVVRLPEKVGHPEGIEEQVTPSCRSGQPQGVTGRVVPLTSVAAIVLDLGPTRGCDTAGVR